VSEQIQFPARINSPLRTRIQALNDVAEAEYPVGLLIAPVILLSNWKELYGELIERLADELGEKVKNTAFIEIILMTYSYVQNAPSTPTHSRMPSAYWTATS